MESQASEAHEMLRRAGAAAASQAGPNNPLAGFLRSALRTREERLNPFAWYRERRSVGPILRDEESQTWDVFGYAQAQSILRNHTHFSSARFAGRESGMGEFTPNILSMDPPRHTELRSLINLAFTPKAIAASAPRITEIAEELLKDVSSRLASHSSTASEEKVMDVVAELSYPLPVIVIAEMMGVPPADRELFKKWSDLLVEGPSDARPEALMDLMNRKMVGRRELNEYFREIVAHQQKHPRDNLIGALLEAQLDGEKLSMEELLSFCVLLLAAGNETTTNLITNTWRCLTEHPDALAEVEANRSMIPGAMEEALRYYSPVQATSRIVLEDVEIEGQQLSKGERVTVWIGSANRDEKMFSESESFDIHRSPNPHMAFGYGIHFCLGAPLARLEAQIALTKMMEYFTNFESVPAPLEPIVSGFVYGVKSFPMKLAQRQ
jgi:cytochrome P450